ncbi:hypothetical protein CTAM01_05759 [Colletotrichum tamarilloi]|uniref:F-box domain-containing protein n=1 Tax=Colletotrichum tamarilloi TaxID=1209934 RepID=A0ABQ9RDE5_9PEZI|nr:uncharacterized protein CTAM01_05759 [Colletotrichum tamarilloi]KAK1501535.1 hypothetical protein CTAM01_05759 [Colletotrichum tamarilloi]
MPSRLPDEMFFAIIKSFTHPEPTYMRPSGRDYATLSNLCRVSRGFQKVAEPFLYHTVWLSDCSFNRFLETIKSKRYLGRYVRHLTIPRGLDHSWAEKDLEEQLFQLQRSAEHGHFKAAIDRYRSGSGELLRFRGAPHMLLLAWLLPEVEIMHCLSDDGQMELIGEVEQPGPFPRLREVHANQWEYLEDRQSFRLSRWEPLLLQGVEAFSGRGIEWNETEQPLALKSVCLFNSLYKAADLTNLLRCCPDLKALSLRWGKAFDSMFNYSGGVPECNGIGEALRQHGKNLRKLELDCRPEFEKTDDYHDPDDVVRLGRIGSLRELARLETLEIPLDMLLGSDGGHGSNPNEGNIEYQSITSILHLSNVLPSSVEVLGLLEDSSKSEERLNLQVQGLRATGSMVKLRSVTVLRSEVIPLDRHELLADVLGIEHKVKESKRTIKISDQAEIEIIWLSENTMYFGSSHL